MGLWNGTLLVIFNSLTVGHVLFYFFLKLSTDLFASLAATTAKSEPSSSHIYLLTTSAARI